MTADDSRVCIRISGRDSDDKIADRGGISDPPHIVGAVTFFLLKRYYSYSCASLADDQRVLPKSEPAGFMLSR